MAQLPAPPVEKVSVPQAIQEVFVNPKPARQSEHEPVVSQVEHPIVEHAAHGLNPGENVPVLQATHEVLDGSYPGLQLVHCPLLLTQLVQFEQLVHDAALMVSLKVLVGQGLQPEGSEALTNCPAKHCCSVV